MASKTLPPRQKSLLTYLKTFLAERGYVPTLAEMAKALGVSSLQAVKGHLTALERKGYLRRHPGQPRAIELLSNRSKDEGIPILGRVSAGLPLLAVGNTERVIPLSPR